MANRGSDGAESGDTGGAGPAAAGQITETPDTTGLPASGSPDPCPLVLETSRRGVFAVGDVRSESVKRVASAVGEGAMAVRLVHERLYRARPS